MSVKLTHIKQNEPMGGTTALSEKQGVGSSILPLATNNYLGYSDKIITNNRNTEQNTEHHSEKAYKH